MPSRIGQQLHHPAADPTGAADPTRASIPLHLAVNGSLEVGHDVGIVLAGDAAEFVKSELRERLESSGVDVVPPNAASASCWD